MEVWLRRMCEDRFTMSLDPDWDMLHKMGKIKRKFLSFCCLLANNVGQSVLCFFPLFFALLTFHFIPIFHGGTTVLS
uniref:Uncharacterized protein n=1 Tax=Rhizophora mucronata TaxID=61149 RepID=A0A2P2P005_RHIMU